MNLDEPQVIIRVMLTSDRAIDDFLGDCRRRRFSERTITTYRRTLDEFAARLPADYDVSKITTDDIRRYLSTKAHLAPGSVAGMEAHLASWLKWLYKERKIAANPIDRLERTRRINAADLDVVTVDPDGVRKLLAAGHTWTEKLAPAIPAYLGPRRRAIAALRLSDYDRDRSLIRFREKGAKVIWKPVPGELARLIDSAIADRAIVEAEDYLVPPEGYLQRKGDRDDRIIWRVVKRVAARAGVEAHVHALRAAFACFYLERNPGDVEALKELMGHRTLKTTEIYLRKLDKQVAMERVRGLSWAVADADDRDATGFPQSAGFLLASSAGVGAGGFEPPFTDIPVVEGAGGQLDPLAPLSRRLERARERSRRETKR